MRPSLGRRSPPGQKTSLGANYRRLWTASGFSNLADGVFQIALPLLALRITRSPGLIAGVALANRLPWLLFALQAGALADRLDRRRTMAHVDLSRAVLLASLALVVGLGHEQLAVLYVVAFALGTGETLFDTAAQSVMPAVVDRDQLPTANARLYVVELSMNQFVGPPIGGFLAGVAIWLAFAGSAACYLVAALALMLLKGRFRAERTGPPTRLRTDIAEGLRYLYGHRVLRMLALMVGVSNLGNTAMWSVLPLFAVAPGPMDLSEAGFGVFLTAAAVGSVVGSWCAPRLQARFGKARTLLLTVFGMAAGTASPLLELPVAVAAAFALNSLMVVAWNVITVSLRQRIVPDHLLGRVNAGYRLLAWGTMPIGAAMGGLIGGVFGLRWVFVVGATMQLALLACFKVITDEALDAAELPVGAASVSP